MKLALVYDRVNKIGGAERVLVALHEIWPEAPLYTAVYNKKSTPWAESFNVRPSFLQKFPLAKIKHEWYPWLTPIAFESFNFDEYDVVISVTSAEAKGIITKPKTLHICYCLTPTRYLWSGYDDYFKNPIKKFLTKPVINYLRSWDKTAAQRPDKYIAISKEVQKRIKTYYDHNSDVIYPPVDIEKFSASKFEIRNSKFEILGPYFLIVSRLVPYKRIDLAVKAFNELGLPLVIVGAGSEESYLRSVAKPNISFAGQVPNGDLTSYYQNCRALIFPGLEDLGITPLEAQARGKPVIAFRGGGVLETVIEGKTGVFFNEQTTSSLMETVKNFNALYQYSIKAENCIENAKKFDKEVFKKIFKEKIEEYRKSPENGKF